MKVVICAPLNETDIARIKEAFPEYEYILTKSLTQKETDEADIIIGNPSTALNLNRPGLKAILLNSAGSDQYMGEGLLHPDTKLANASGSYGKAISEQAIGMILALNKNLKTYSLQMEKNCWNKLPNGKELFHSNVCIVGYGDLGYEIAKRLKGFDCRITAVKRRVTEESKSLPYADYVAPMEELDKILSESDFVVLTLPQNQSTIGMFDKERLLKMKKDAVLVNVGRGSAIVTEDLIEVMESGHLYGAALDVTEPEPLPADSRLWSIPNVLITPHSSGGFVWKSVHDNYTDIIIENLKHLEANEELLNEVDLQTGYRKKVTYKN